METLTNFTLVRPSALQQEKYKNAEGVAPQFLMSAEGVDWYESHALFADNTIKIMYRADGVIESVVDKPVEDRGNILAVSMFFPLNMSVSEIDGSLPEGFETDSLTWCFDGESVYQDAELLAGYNRRRNSPTYQQLLSSAALEQQQLVTTALLAQSGAGDPLTPAEVNYLSALQAYISALKSVNLEISAPDWPSVPVAP